MTREPGKKAESTRTRILEAALSVFQERGFEQATMRDIATAAEVAVGAAYYYFPSKDSIVMAFYERAQQEMSPAITAALADSKTFQQRMSAIVHCKLAYFENSRKLLGALSAHADPQHPLSPFSRETQAIRERDIAFFELAVKQSNLKLPPGIKPYFPRLLWLYQMGLLLFWVYDHSSEQWRTRKILQTSLKMMNLALKIAVLPIFRPVHRLTAELLEAAYAEE